jgi:hypothetical protein
LKSSDNITSLAARADIRWLYRGVREEDEALMLAAEEGAEEDSAASISVAVIHNLQSMDMQQ